MATAVQQPGERPARRVRSVRFTPKDVLAPLGLLGGLAGTWKGHGFNLIARPDFHDNVRGNVTDLYLQLNHTRETLTFTPIGGPVPNRGFGQDDIELFGLTYLQQISDAAQDGALHIEPGIWVTQPNTTFPPESVPAPAQLVARMGTIPHGNSVLAEGIAEPFNGPPVLTIPGTQYSFSKFPSFNSTPFGVRTDPTTGILTSPINAAGSSEKLTAPTIPATPFPPYDLNVAIGPIPPGPIPAGPPPGPVYNPPFTLNTRTPFETAPLDPPIPNTPQNQAWLTIRSRFSKTISRSSWTRAIRLKGRPSTSQPRRRSTFSRSPIAVRAVRSSQSWRHSPGAASKTFNFSWVRPSMPVPLRNRNPNRTLRHHSFMPRSGSRRSQMRITATRSCSFNTRKW
jgi:hypothetical protein